MIESVFDLWDSTEQMLRRQSEAGLLKLSSRSALVSQLETCNAAMEAEIVMGLKPALSIEEIDELAQAFTAVHVHDKRSHREVRGYDFAQPEKLSKTHLRAIQYIFSELEHSWSVSLSSALKSKTKVQANPVHQTAFGEYAGSLPLSGLAFEVSMDPLPGPMLIHIPMALAASLTDRLLGGRGMTATRPKPLTPVQSGILTCLISRLLEEFSSAWHPVAQLKLSVSRLHASFDDIEIDGGETMLVVGTVWNTQMVDGSVSIAIPASSLDGIMDDLDPQKWCKTEIEHTQGSPESMADLLEIVDLPMSVELGHTKVSVRDVLGMDAGDIVRLDIGVNQPLSVRIGDRTRFQARPGLVGKRLSVQIV